MDTTRFDQVAKLVSTGVSRRSSLRLLLATVAGVIPISDTIAKKQKKQSKQKANKCRPPKKRCGQKCVAIKTNRNNCGACRNVCAADQVCRRGVCVTTCTPECTGKACGPDGCGGSCGSCGGNTSCANGACVPDCTRNCAGKDCGGDGCGGSCGTCGSGRVCSNGTCVQDCTPNCAGKNCGPNGCGGSCGTCGGGETCSNGTCQPVCTRNCSGKNCGSDGCGGSCGTCSDGRVCSNPGSGGTCQCPAVSCGGICCASGQLCFGAACWPDDQESAFVSLINNHRAANGLSPLTLQNQLGAAAELHSQDQAANNFSSHTGSDGSTVPQRFTRAGYSYSWWGENIFWGGATASEAFTMWRNSPGHNANMLSTNFTQFGIGRARSSAGTWYWTTTFGRP